MAQILSTHSLWLTLLNRAFGCRASDPRELGLAFLSASSGVQNALLLELSREALRNEEAANLLSLVVPCRF